MIIYKSIFCVFGKIKKKVKDINKDENCFYSNWNTIHPLNACTINVINLEKKKYYADQNNKSSKKFISNVNPKDKCKG